MLPAFVVVLLVASLVVAWRRLGLSSGRLSRVILVAVIGGFVGAFALYAALWLQPIPMWPTWLIMLSDGLLLFPLVMLTRSGDPILLSVAAPLLLSLELSLVLVCVMVPVRVGIQMSQRREPPPVEE